MSIYRFPANGRAKACSLHEQLMRVTDEAAEAYVAEADGEGAERIIEELLDTIHAAEGALRKFKPQKVRDGYLQVVAKNNQRGDYSTSDLVSGDWGMDIAGPDAIL